MILYLQQYRNQDNINKSGGSNFFEICDFEGDGKNHIGNIVGMERGGGRKSQKIIMNLRQAYKKTKSIVCEIEMLRQKF